MRDENDARTALLEFPEKPEETFHFRSFQGRGRFVKDENLRFDRNCFKNFDDLLLCDIEVLDESLRRSSDVECPEIFLVWRCSSFLLIIPRTDGSRFA